MNNHTFSTPDLSTFCQLNKLGLVATGQHTNEKHAVIECRFTQSPKPCPQCAASGISRGTVDRRLSHVLYGQRPTTLLLRIRRFSCACGCFWHEDTSSAAPSRSKLSYGAIRWALAAIVIDHLSVSRVAAHLGVAWHTANNAIIQEGQRLLFNDPVRNKTGPARLLDVLEGRSKQAFKQWLESRPKPWRDQIESIAMDDFSGFKSAAQEVIPKAQTVLDPFHVVRWASNMLDDCHRRIQQETLGRIGHKNDPLYKHRRTMLTRISYLSEANKVQLNWLFSDERYLEVDCSWSMYQRVVTAYNEPDRRRGKKLMQALIKLITEPDLPVELIEVKRLGTTLKKHAQSILAYFDRSGTSNGPTEAINGRLENLRGIALGFRNLTNYIARCLLESGGFKKQLHP
ncbi:MAG TPA: ISL3 family transposase [Marinospirillum sp.]|uniref:ISL3 family transposase n=1 Tax=Marinospirillum sp. TaxID=2183934 RepID=UPI002B4A82F0|nr:ISL3 family transposase [Marinospirillum sp.]HKM16029.1 ISL3 family transposase [Marinospirillum sp.]